MTEDLRPGADRRVLEVFGAWKFGRDEEFLAQFDYTMRTRLTRTWLRLTGLVGAYELSGDPVVRPFGECTVVNVLMEFESGAMGGRRVVFGWWVSGIARRRGVTRPWGGAGTTSAWRRCGLRGCPACGALGGSRPVVACTSCRGR